MKTKGYLALGGNLGDTRLLFRTALRHLSALPCTQVLSVASLYRTPAIGCYASSSSLSSSSSFSSFLNTVCAFSTELSLANWMEEVERIERLLGKLPKPKEAPRPIDLDLLFWNHECHTEGRWHVPHPRWHTRAFVVRPLMDLTPYVEVKPPSGQDLQRICLQTLLEQLSLENNAIRRVAWG